MRRVVVTGLGAVTPLGIGVKRTWSRLLEGHSGLVSTAGRGVQFRALPSQVAAVVPEGPKEEGKWTASEWIKFGDERRMARFTQYAVAASEEALEDASWHPRSEEDQNATGVCLGSGIGNFEDIYNTSIAYAQDGYRKVSPLFVPRLLTNMAAGHLSILHRLHGPNHSVTTACTTGAHAIGDAARFIQFGDADVMLAGGSESCIHPLAMAGFARAMCLSTSFTDVPILASRPFDGARDGFVIGEGAGVLVLEELQHALARKAHIYAEVRGYGLSSDAHHMTTPPPDGRGAVLCMRRALAHACIPPAAVSYINAHATSTVAGDAAENQAITHVMLGEKGVANVADINVSSVKGALGHLLGAAGAVEAIVSVLAIRDNVVPPTLNLEYPGGEGSEGFDCNYVARHAQQRQVDVVLSNSFGFGGTNASLVFARY